MENERFLKIEQVAVVLGVSVKTINNWYAFKRQDPENDIAVLLPDFIQNGKRQTRYWRECDIPKFIEFKSALPLGRNGIMGGITQKYYHKKEKENGKKKH